MAESGRLATGKGAVAIYGVKDRARAPLTSGGSIADGDLLYLSSGSLATCSASAHGASFVGVAEGATPTYDAYGDQYTPLVTCLVGGVILVGCDSGTYQVGQPLYLSTNYGNTVTNVANGTQIGTVTSPPGSPLPSGNTYAGAVTQVYMTSKHPGFAL